MVEPINRIDLQAPLESQTYEELRPLVRRIGTQNQQIRDQMKHLPRSTRNRTATAGSSQPMSPMN